MHPLCLLLPLALAEALPAKGHLVLHERRYSDDGSKRVPIDPYATIPLRIGLTHQNLDYGYKLLTDIFDPSSITYGKHLTAEDVHSTFGPSAETVKAVRDWLVSEGVNARDIIHATSKGWLAVDLPVRKVEKMLGTEYFEYERPGTDRVMVGCDSYQMPAGVRRHIDLVKPAVVRVRAERRFSRAGKGTAERTYGKRNVSPDSQKLEVPSNSLVVERDVLGLGDCR